MTHIDPVVVGIALALGYVVAKAWWWFRCRTYRKRPIPTWLWREVMERGRWTCANRWCRSTTDLQADHKWPEWFFGRMTLENLQVLCASCNRRKGAKVKCPGIPWVIFWAWIGLRHRSRWYN